jgi:cysteine desulfurase
LKRLKETLIAERWRITAVHHPSLIILHLVSMPRIYLDFNASTPLAPEVVEAMRPFLSEHFGNPSSPHWAGRPARESVESARSDVAELLGAKTSEIIFTSGGSEANNHAIKGVFFRVRSRKPHIITTRVEHPAVIEPCKFLEKLGASVTLLPVDSTGMVDPDDVRRAISRHTVLISVMHANNEVGTIQPIAAIAQIARERGIPLHTDAAQSVGKIAANVREIGVDLLAVAGHKLYAPKGVGALFVREGVELEPFIHGAGHESGRRAGTENVLLIVALGAACRLARLEPCGERIQKLRDNFWKQLRDAFGDGVVLNGHETERLPNTLNVSFPDTIGQEILDRLDGIAASTGSACHAGSHQMSPVLCAMGLKPRVGLGAIRFSLGRTTTLEEIETVVKSLRQVFGR